MMRSLFRIVLPVAILLVLVGGVSYFMQYTPPAPDRPPSKTETTSPTPTLLFLDPDLTVKWDPADPDYAQEFEKGSKGHYDFWLANPHPVPASVVLRLKSCTCVHLELGIVDPTAEAEFLRQASQNGLKPSAPFEPKQGGLDRAALAPLVDRVRWTPFGETDRAITIPAADPKAGIRLAAFRFHWEPKEAGAMRFSATLNVVGGDPKPAERVLQVPLVMVPPVQIVPAQIQLDDIKAGDVRNFTLILWSSTRDSFPCELPKLPDDPCFVFGAPKPMTAEECRSVSKDKLPKEYPDQPRTRIKAGYFVPFTVYERMGDSVLELGPLNRRLVFDAATPLETSAYLSGMVRGEILLSGSGVKDGDDRISLGDFRGDRPLTKVVLLNCTRADLKLKLISSSPDSMKVSFKERPGLGAGWELRLEFPPNSMSGPLPPGSCIVLETLDSPPRRMRIPVSGLAFFP